MVIIKSAHFDGRIFFGAISLHHFRLKAIGFVVIRYTK